MKSLQTYFLDAFRDEKITDSELSSFTEDHLNRLTAANTDGSQTARLATTRAVYETFTQSLQREDIAANQRTGMTQSMSEAKAAFTQFVTRKEGVIRDALGGNKLTMGYLEFYPHGLTEYSGATLEQIEPLLERFVAAAQRHTTQLGAALATEAAALKASFLSARAAQLAKKGTVSAEKSAGKAARQALTQQLTKNLLLLAAENIGHPERVTVFFDQTRLTDS